MDNFNIANRLLQFSQKTPDNKAITFPKKVGHKYHYSSLTFRELEDRANSFAHLFLNAGLKKMDKVLVFIKPSLNFSAITFALFKVGLVPIFIDPGMGKKNLLNAIAHIKPVGLIAEQAVHFLRLIYKDNFRSVKIFINNGNINWGKMISLQEFVKFKNKPLINEVMKKEDPAAILFTSGGTGSPKGVHYNHGIFNAQTEMLQEMFNLTEEDIDLPGFPLFSLFTIAMGMNSCIPDMDPSKPAKCNPENLVKNIIDNKATFVAGSPAIWERVAIYCDQNNIKLPSVKYLVMFGAPVRFHIHELFKNILTNGDTYTPYGATECLPVSNAKGSDILEYKKDYDNGKGTYIGHGTKGIRLKVIQTSDDKLKWEQITECQANILGEIIVNGPTVTPFYVDMEKETNEAKIIDQNGDIWHRMGDIGYLDNNNALWFCGRKTHRVDYNDKTYASIQLEGIINSISEIEKSAMINFHGKPAIVISAQKTNNKKILKDKVLSISKANELTNPIDHVFFSKKFPVDVRHNIKIDRKKLSQMAELGKLK